MQNNFYYDIIKSAARSGSAFYVFWPRGQAVKTSPFHGGNTGSIPVGVSSHGQSADYKSEARNEYADVAQLAEQLICNQQVIGSSPIIGFVPGGTVIIADL